MAIQVNAEGITHFLQTIDWQNPSWDLMLVIFFVISALLYGMSLGRDRLLVILMSIYMSLAVVQTLPQAVLSLQFEKFFAFHVTAFVGIFLVLFFFLSRSALLRTFGSKASQGKVWQVILLSILHVGLLVSVVFSFFPKEVLANFSPITQMIFTHEWGRFGWTTAPVLAMMLMKSKSQPPHVE